MGRQIGFARPNRYLVLILPTSKVQNFLGMDVGRDLIRLASNVKSVNINEQTWFTTEQVDLNAGPGRVFPYKKNTNNSSGFRIQFNVGADMYEKELFDSWMRFIQDPFSRQNRYYDDYANQSEAIVIFLPNNIPNFENAVNAVFSDPAQIIGYRFTEVYPYAISMNGGALNYQQANEPLFIDVALMYRDMIPLTLKKPAIPEAIKPVTESGFPVIDDSWSKQILEDSRNNLNRAVDGFVVNSQNAREAFVRNQAEQDAALRRNNNLLQANVILSQVQGFFGVGFFGNGFNP
jgi:hypothetical protein